MISGCRTDGSRDSSTLQSFFLNTESSEADLLNSLSYACHYRDADSTEYYARRVLSLSSCRDDQRAEALNNLAFAAMVRMSYQVADSLLREAAASTDNQIELLVSYVQLMRLCQRRSQNREFYECREKAVSAWRRISEERDQLSAPQRRRLCYAESEMAIVTSTYYYYVGLERQSADALQQLNVEETRHDTAQYLNYLYNIGAGGILADGTSDEIHREEVDYLRRCLAIAQRHNYPYFEAQAKEALAEHDNSLTLAEEALRLFTEYGDVYQIAGAHRTLASCYHAKEDDVHALYHLEQALADTAIYQAPDLVASIHEQLSVVYSALNDKPNSDYSRNIYIDLQEQTRQDRELEARAGLLDQAVRQLNWMITAVVGAIVMLIFLLWLFNYQNKKQRVNHEFDDLLAGKEEEVASARLRVEHNERRHLEQRAKVSLAMSILPLIDRIKHAISQLDGCADGGVSELEYVCELTDNINELNSQLTEWIQLRQGELSLRIESFSLQGLFDIVEHSRTGFQMKGITLDVQPTEAIVKADKVLTLFMLNTLADNARKFTAQGGRVDLFATEGDNFVEVSVQDTGGGTPTGQPSHGFGLKNCRGIIEKYRKMSQLFNVCLLSSETRQEGGSRYFFRLPKGVLRCWAIAVCGWMLGADGCHAQYSAANQHPLDRAHVYADSAYFSNVNGTYARTLLFADSCLNSLNDEYLRQHPQGGLLMRRDGDDTGNMQPAEIQWLRQGIETNYQIILDIRNESAVAALALHEWKLYEYNNKVYTQLFKELSADNTLADYCRTMQQSQANKRIAVILLLLLLVLLLPAYFMLYYRHRLYRRFSEERQQQARLEMADDELRQAELENANLHVANAVLDNCLSTLKHETMYYPSRIRQLADSGQIEPLAEVANYYRELYAILIQQANAQVERIHLHIRKQEWHGQWVLGDENLLRYLFELLKGDVSAIRVDDKYVCYHITLTNQPGGAVQGQQGRGLSQVSYYLARQIVRDHGEATNRRGCGINIDGNQVSVTLPAASQPQV